MKIEVTCPSCAQKQEIDEDRIMPTHDRIPPMRALCPASGWKAPQDLRTIRSVWRTRRSW